MKINQIGKGLNILFLTNAHNGMSQRALLELTENRNHKVTVELAIGRDSMIAAKQRTHPDLIICPFLTSRVPHEVFSDKKVPCLIVHPGVQGDRGMSSLDWALKKREERWGVTVLQADEEMDSGAIWSSKTFPLSRHNMDTMTKSSLYRNEVVDTAMKCILESVDKFRANVRPKPLDYSDKETIGTLQRNMKQADRSFTWNQSAAEIVHNIRFSDGQPGVRLSLYGETYFAFDAYEDNNRYNQSDSSLMYCNGDVVGQRDGAIAVKASDGLVWLGSLKSKNLKIKLPATLALPEEIVNILPILQQPPTEYDFPDDDPLSIPRNGFQEIWTSTRNGICYVNFNFYNGACGTDQCRRLEKLLNEIRDTADIKTVVLMGGYNSFSNGIHLNEIENSEDPVEESERNINAIDDVVRAVFRMSDKVVISALQGGAGAGGVMFALAANYIIAHRGVILNPHYRLMGLHGSEYWTHFLPMRVAKKQAKYLTESKAPISASYAKQIKLIDEILGNNVEEFRSQLVPHLESIFLDPALHSRVVSHKRQVQTKEWFERVEAARTWELGIMYRNFRSMEYSIARRQFVRKIKPISTPPHLRGFTARKMDIIAVQKRIEADTRKTGQELIPENSDSHWIPNICIILQADNTVSDFYILERQSLCHAAGLRCVTRRDKGHTITNHNQNFTDNNDVMCGIVGLSNNSVSSYTPFNDEFSTRNLSPKLYIPKGVIRLLLEHGVQLYDKNVAVIKRNTFSVSEQMENFLQNEGMNVWSCDLQEVEEGPIKNGLTNADIIISDCDLSLMKQVTTDMLKQGLIWVTIPKAFSNGENIFDEANLAVEKIDNHSSKASLYTSSGDNMEKLSFTLFLHDILKDWQQSLGYSVPEKLQATLPVTN